MLGMDNPSELGAFLRARRARVRPEDVGLPGGEGARRTPGLRREEVAALAGVSFDYLKRLEQGSERRPSTSVVDALAGALLLDDDARTHLHGLVARGDRSPIKTATARSRGVRPAIARMLEALRPSPAYVLSPRSDLLAANPEALALFAGLIDWPAPQRNTIRYVFVHPLARDLFADWPGTAVAAVANLRAAAASDPDPSGARALVHELASASCDFAREWERHEVRPRRSRPKTFNHPLAGRLTLQHEVLHLPDDGQRLAVYQAEPGTADYKALNLLSLAVRAAEAPSV